MIIALLFIVLLANEANGQEKFITLQREPLAMSNRAFYVKGIADARANPNDVGFAQVGLFNKKVLVKFEAGIKRELMDYFHEVLPPEEGQTPVILQLLILRVGERTGAFSEKAKAEAKIAFYIEREGRWGKVYETTATHESGGMDVTKSHERNLRIVIEKCLQAFAASDWKTTEPVYVDLNRAPTKPSVAAPSAGEIGPIEAGAASSRGGLKEHKYSFGLGGIGALQQNQIPFQFGTGLRFFFGARDMRRLNTEVAIDYIFSRNMANDTFFAFGDETIAYAFTQAGQLNLDVTGKIALGESGYNFPYFGINLGLTRLFATNAKSVTNSTLTVKDAKASISGIYFGGGLGYKYYTSLRLFFDVNATFNFVIINSAVGGKKSGRLPKSISSKAESFKVQLGYAF